MGCTGTLMDMHWCHYGYTLEALLAALEAQWECIGGPMVPAVLWVALEALWVYTVGPFGSSGGPICMRAMSSSGGPMGMH